MQSLVVWYPLLRTIHITLALTSGAFFLVRGTAVLAGAGWPVTLLARRLSHVLDATLLTSAVLLLITLRLNPFTTPWLAVKLSFLIAYIGCGMVALHRGRTSGVRAAAFAAAIICFWMIYRVARTHDPMGFVG